MATNTTQGRQVQAIRQAQKGMEVPFDLSLIRKAPGFEIPDIEGTVEGWRAWTVAKELPPFGVDPKMHSVVHSYTWYPQQVAEAECGTAHSKRHDGPAADPRCSCGFYSAKTLKHLMSMGYHSYQDYDSATMIKVVGRVANWGQVTEGTQGWRSQYSYPVMLFVPYEAAKTLAGPLKKAFGCKVRPLNFLKKPGEINQLEIVAGVQEPIKLERGKITNRKCRHKTKPFTGWINSEPFDKNDDGEEWVQVRWDARPDDKVNMRLANLDIQPITGSGWD